jgi:hypothetical protein
MSRVNNRKGVSTRFTALRTITDIRRKESAQRRHLLSLVVEALEVRSLLSGSAIDWAVESLAHPTGLIDPGPEVQAYEASDSLHAEAIKLTQLGLDRINESRQAEGLPTLTAADAANDLAPYGSDIIATMGPESDNSTAGLPAVLAAGGLPSEVDNSRLPAFPPIGDQGSLGSCVSFSTTYYQLTYEEAIINGWDTHNRDYSKIFSPKQ